MEKDALRQEKREKKLFGERQKTHLHAPVKKGSPKQDFYGTMSEVFELHTKVSIGE